MSGRGITLFELLVVLVLIGVIAAFAFRHIASTCVRVHRAEAMTALLQLQSAEESHYLQARHLHRQRHAAPPAGLGLPSASASNRYALSVALAADGQSFIATATPTPGGGQTRGSRMPRLFHRRAREARRQRGGQRAALLEVDRASNTVVLRMR